MSWRERATDIADVFSAISAASSRAAGRSCEGAHHAAHEAALQGLLRREHAAREHPFRGARHADEPRQEPRAARLGHDAAAGEDEADARGRGRDADVHRQRHGDPEAHRRPVDGGDHRLLHVEDAQRYPPASVAMLARRLASPPRRAVEGLPAARQIGPRAERAARARDDHRAHGIVGIRLVERRDQLVDHHGRHGVQPLGPVEGEGADAVRHGIRDLPERRHPNLPRPCLGRRARRLRSSPPPRP